MPYLKDKTQEITFYNQTYFFTIKQSLMLILSLFFAVVLMHIGKDVSEQGVSIYQSPRFWVQVLSMMLITGITVFN